MMRFCSWCPAPIAPRSTSDRRKRTDSLFCSKRCRQRAWRLRERADELGARRERADAPLLMAYADPPYPGCAKKYYGREPSFAGEVDHVALIRRLATYDGWALSTGTFALRDLLPLCPHGARIATWVKPGRPRKNTYGPQSVKEELIVVPGRRLRPGVPDVLCAAPARLGGSELAGRKPLAFCAWLFALLGLLPGDTFDDLYPGSGVVRNAWRELGRVAHLEAATRPVPAASDVSGRGEYSSDASRAGADRPVATPAAPTGREQVLGDAWAPPHFAAPAARAGLGRRRRVPLGPIAER